jgi:hypothetical protein
MNGMFLSVYSKYFENFLERRKSMNEKMEHLIHNLTKIHNKIIIKYKNLEAIEGQYNQNIKTVAKILRLQTENKNKVYQTMLLDASNLETEITEDGHKEVLALEKKCEAAIVKAMSPGNNDIIQTAVELSKIKISLFTDVLDILNRYESEKNIVHEALKEKVVLIQKLEEKDYATLQSFIKNNKL